MSKRARTRKSETAKADLKPPLVFYGGQGVHREVESEGLAKKYQAVVEGATPWTNRSAKGGARSSLHYWGEGVLIHPPYQGVCGRQGMEDQRVTPGGLVRSAGGTAVTDPISVSEMGRNARRGVGQPNRTLSAVKAVRPRMWQPSGLGKSAGEEVWEQKGQRDE